MPFMVKITVHTPPCAQCGEIDIMCRPVLHADGQYCRHCAPIVAMKAARHARAQRRGNSITIPTQNWHPHNEN